MHGETRYRRNVILTKFLRTREPLHTKLNDLPSRIKAHKRQFGGCSIRAVTGSSWPRLTPDAAYSRTRTDSDGQEIEAISAFVFLIWIFSCFSSFPPKLAIGLSAGT
jgi:hypothetical protein